MNYEELHRQYYHRILRYLGSIVGQTDAEDVAQEVFAKASMKLDSLKEPSKVSPWLFKIAVNTACDLLRQRSSRKEVDACFQSAGPTPLRDTEDRGDPLDRTPDTRNLAPDERLQYTEMVKCYLDFVRRLPDRYFEVYVLSEIENLDDRTISRRLKLPLSTVKMRLHRARQSLYDALRQSCRCYTNAHGELMGTLK